jgi:hypothetical protein
MSIKCAKTRLRASVISKNFPEYHGSPLKGETPDRGKGGKRREREEGKVKGEAEKVGRERPP